MNRNPQTESFSQPKFCHVLPLVWYMVSCMQQFQLEVILLPQQLLDTRVLCKWRRSRKGIPSFILTLNTHVITCSPALSVTYTFCLSLVLSHVYWKLRKICLHSQLIMDLCLFPIEERRRNRKQPFNFGEEGSDGAWWESSTLICVWRSDYVYVCVHMLACGSVYDG